MCRARALYVMTILPNTGWVTVSPLSGIYSAMRVPFTPSMASAFVIITFPTPLRSASNALSILGIMPPVYSNQPQINQSENGVDNLKQQITRYLCLYPHAGMMLKLTIVDPPSVETVVAMLKALIREYPGQKIMFFDDNPITCFAVKKQLEKYGVSVCEVL